MSVSQSVRCVGEWSILSSSDYYVGKNLFYQAIFKLKESDHPFVRTSVLSSSREKEREGDQVYGLVLVLSIGDYMVHKGCE